MTGTIEDKAKYALRGYDVERGGGCDWYVTGYDKVKHKLRSCVYERGRAVHPAKVVRILKEAVMSAGIKPKGYVPHPTSKEVYEGTLHDEGSMEEAKEVYEKTKADVGATPESADTGAIDIKKSSPVILVIIFIGVLGYLLFGNIRRG